MKKNKLEPSSETKAFQNPNLHRRKFLANMGIAAVTASGLAACQKLVNSGAVSNMNAENAATGAVGDIAILNYAYLLEQLEAAFYITVANSFYSGASSMEKLRLQQIRDHEIAHREFFKTALGSKAIPEQQFDFSSINFSSRMSVLSASKAFEDTGVSAYNGIAYAITTPDYLLVAGKIVSVEARHAAYIRDLLDPVSFADSSVIDSNGLDLASSPQVVVKAIAPYLKVRPDMTSFPYNL